MAVEATEGKLSVYERKKNSAFISTSQFRSYLSRQRHFGSRRSASESGYFEAVQLLSLLSALRDTDGMQSARPGSASSDERGRQMSSRR